MSGAGGQAAIQESGIFEIDEHTDSNYVRRGHKQQAKKWKHADHGKGPLENPIGMCMPDYIS